MVNTALILGTLAALAAAIPQQAEHISKAQLSRVNQIFARDELAGRGIFPDGSCGTTSGFTCSPGNCCSSLGWCGSTPLHCGTGCQSGFGNCGSDSSSGSAPAPVAPPAAPPAAAPTLASAPAPQSPPAPVPDNKPAPQTSPVASSGQGSTGPKSGGLGDSYKQYSGDGSTGAGWPSQDQWVDFETSFTNNKPHMQASCGTWGVPSTSDSEVQEIHDAILAASSSSGVDSRYILAIVMQESGGCVRVPTTNWGVRNPGLMQSFNGQGTCNEGGVQTPCPSSEITQMINDGTSGTGAGSNSLSSALASIGGDDVSKYYKAARKYNSGSIDASGSLQAGIATHCYSSDVANRLTGWVSAAHSCTFDG